MADVLHASLTGADLHECKGADTASLGQVPVSNGSGSAPFGNLNYQYLSGKPTVPEVRNGTTALTGVPKIAVFQVTAAADGTWTLSISGFSTVLAVYAMIASGSSTVGNTGIATVNTFNTSSASGGCVALGASGNSMITDGRLVRVTVIGN